MTQQHDDDLTAARAFVARFGVTAEQEARQRAHELAGAGDEAGRVRWLEIAKTVAAILREDARGHEN